MTPRQEIARRVRITPQLVDGVLQDTFSFDDLRTTPSQQLKLPQKSFRDRLLSAVEGLSTLLKDPVNQSRNMVQQAQERLGDWLQGDKTSYEILLEDTVDHEKLKGIFLLSIGEVHIEKIFSTYLQTAAHINLIWDEHLKKKTIDVFEALHSGLVVMYSTYVDQQDDIEAKSEITRRHRFFMEFGKELYRKILDFPTREDSTKRPTTFDKKLLHEVIKLLALIALTVPIENLEDLEEYKEILLSEKILALTDKTFEDENVFWERFYIVKYYILSKIQPVQNLRETIEQDVVNGQHEILREQARSVYENNGLTLAKTRSVLDGEELDTAIKDRFIENLTTLKINAQIDFCINSIQELQTANSGLIKNDRTTFSPEELETVLDYATTKLDYATTK